MKMTNVHIVFDNNSNDTDKKNVNRYNMCWKTLVFLIMKFSLELSACKVEETFKYATFTEKSQKKNQNFQQAMCQKRQSRESDNLSVILYVRQGP